MYNIEKVLTEEQIDDAMRTKELKFIYLFDNGKIRFFDGKKLNRKELIFERICRSLDQSLFDEYICYLINGGSDYLH